MSNPHNLKPGDTLYYRTMRSGDADRIVKITKVGRDWAQIESAHFRVNLETLEGDIPNFGGMGQCWLSKAAWQAERDLTVAWKAFCDDVHRRRYGPTAVTLDQINEARRVLGMEEAK